MQIRCALVGMPGSGKSTVGRQLAHRAGVPFIDLDHRLEQTLGTTIRAAGSQQAFYKVDHDHPLEVAYLARRWGARAYAFNSALGADASSRVFYARTKGETERDLQAVGYPSLTFVRPGLIGGARVESRPAEQVAVKVLQWVQPLLPRRWRVVPAERIAHHLVQAAVAAAPGVHVLPSEALL